MPMETPAKRKAPTLTNDDASHDGDSEEEMEEMENAGEEEAPLTPTQKGLAAATKADASLKCKNRQPPVKKGCRVKAIVSSRTTEVPFC